jgi:hypothetical protein
LGTDQLEGVGDNAARSYVCGYCDRTVGPRVSYYGSEDVPGRTLIHYVYICSYCSRPSFFEGNEEAPVVMDQVPGASFGSPVAALGPEVAELYDEARRCMSVSAYTSAVLACRKILMNVAVAEGVAEEGESFVAYVEALANAGYVPPKGGMWLDTIRKLGNEATHEIAPKTRADAEAALTFTEMLLRLTYEYPAMAEEASAEDPSP